MKILNEVNTKRVRRCWRCRTKFVYDLTTDVFDFCDEYIKCPACGKNLYFLMFDRMYKGKVE